MHELRSQPWRLFFPLGVALAWAGVSHWLLLALGVIESYRSIFHSMAQIQGFMACFAAGFLFTMIPRRTQTAPPSIATLAIAALSPIGLAACAWEERWAVSQIFWIVWLVDLVAFAIPRVRAARRAGGLALPSSFVWVAVAIVLGFAGAVLAGVGAATGHMELHDVGRGLILQGVFTSLVLGVGGFVMPMITRGEAPEGGMRAIAAAFHLAAAALYTASFWLEIYRSVAAGFALRALICAAVLVGGASLHRLPTQRELHRKLVWIAGWMLPIGNAAVALAPSRRAAGLHVEFIGGFALLAFAVSVHVARSHAPVGSAPARSRALPALPALLAIALAMRVAMDLDNPRRTLWMGGAAACFLAATLVWLGVVGKYLRGGVAHE